MTDGAPVPPGLCSHCAWARVITNRLGATFVLCRRATQDARLARYPVLPVVECWGYEHRNEGDDG